MKIRTLLLVGGSLLAVFVVMPLLSRLMWGGFTEVGIGIFGALVLWALLSKLRGPKASPKIRNRSAVCTVGRAMHVPATSQVRVFDYEEQIAHLMRKRE